MATYTEQILKEAIGLSSIERANLVDKLLSSLDQPDKAIDEIWRREIEDRIAVYDAGMAETISVGEVLAKYKKE